MLRQLPQDALPVLREEAVPARAGSDIAFMGGFLHDRKRNAKHWSLTRAVRATTAR